MKIKSIDGIYNDSEMFIKTEVFVRYTNDNIGKTLSLQAFDVEIIVPFEEIEKIIGDKK